VQARGLDVADQLAPLVLEESLSGCGSGKAQRFPWKDEQGPAHCELLDQRALDVQRPLHIGHLDALDACPRRDVDGGRISRVQADHAPGRLYDVTRATARSQAVTASKPRASLVNVDLASCHRRPHLKGGRDSKRRPPLSVQERAGYGS
jgi:hypothetical protein